MCIHSFLNFSISVLKKIHYIDGLDVKEVEMEQAVALVRSRTFSASYTLPQHRKKISRMGTRSPTYTDGKDGAPSQTTAAVPIPEEESDHGEVLMFHGVILRSQLVEMIKNKIFFDENDGVREKLHEVWREGGREKDYSSLLLSCILSCPSFSLKSKS